MGGEIQFAIIGCGRIAQRHAREAARVGRLLAVCDIRQERAAELANQYRAQAYTDIAAMLAGTAGIDVVVVCSPNGLHAAHTIQALNAGCNVLCEKPMAITVESAEAMMAAAGRNGRLLLVVKQNRFNPPVAAVKQLLQQHRLGRIYSFQLSCFWNRRPDYYQDWKGTAALDGGTLFTQFSHFIDLLYWFLGDVQQVQAILANYAHKGIIDFEDTGIALLQFGDGITGTLNYTVNSYGQNMEGSLTIFGEKGTVKIGGGYLNKLSYQSIEGYQLPALADGAMANDYGSYQGSMNNHDKVYDNLVNVLHHQAPAAAGAEDGLKTVAIISRIYQAAKYL